MTRDFANNIIDHADLQLNSQLFSKMISLKFLLTLALMAFIAITLPQSSEAQRNRRADCPQICPALYSPVCATLKNGSRMDFANACASNAAACQQKLGKQEEHGLLNMLLM